MTVFNKKAVWLWISFLAVLLSFFTVRTLKCEAKTMVRVGCVDIDGFLTMDENGNVEGYAAEYLNRISQYADWNYTYIRGSWSECLRWLKEGKIDLLLPAEYSEERAKDFLYSKDICCMDYAALVGRKDDSNYYYEDYPYFNGMTVGVISGNYLNQVFEAYAREHHFQVQTKEYPNGTILNQALKQKEVDAIVNGNMTFLEEQKLLAKIEYMPAYFIVSKQKPELFKALKKAQHAILLDNPYYVAELHQKYYGNVEQQAVGYTRGEAQFVQNSPELTVLCNENNHPMAWYDKKNEKMKGIYPDILQILEKKSGLKFKLVPVSDSQNALQMLKDRKANLMMGVYPNEENLKTYLLNFTDSFYEMPYMILTKRNRNIFQEGSLTAAVPSFSTSMIPWMKENHRDWKVVMYGNWEQCVKAVKSGKADVLPVNALVWQTMEVFQTEPELVNIATQTSQVPVAMAVAGTENPLLTSVLNKTLKKIEKEEIESCVLKNTMSVSNQVTWRTVLHQYPGQAAALCALIGILIVFSAALFYVNHLRALQNGVLEEKNRQLEEAAKKEKELKKQAQTDKLTKLYDKITTENKCREYLEQGKGGAMFIIDIDKFKQINDRQGHYQGDRVLRCVGELLKNCCRMNDIAGRIGGDEFLLLFKGMQNQDIIRNRVQELYERQKEMNHQGCEIGLSIGIAIAPEHGTNFEQLFLAADSAMYQAKEAGRNQYRIYGAHQVIS